MIRSYFIYLENIYLIICMHLHAFHTFIHLFQHYLFSHLHLSYLHLFYLHSTHLFCLLFYLDLQRQLQIIIIKNKNNFYISQHYILFH